MTVLAAFVLLATLPQQEGYDLQGYAKGRQLASVSITVGGPQQSLGIKGDEHTVYVVHIEGTGSTPGGRQVDGLYTFVDPYWTFGLPNKAVHVELLYEGDNLYREWEFYWPHKPGSDTPAYRNDHVYEFLIKPN